MKTLENIVVMGVTPEQVGRLLNLITIFIAERVKLEVSLCFFSSETSYRLLSIFFGIYKASLPNFIPGFCDALSKAFQGQVNRSVVKHSYVG